MTALNVSNLFKETSPLAEGRALISVCCSNEPPRELIECDDPHLVATALLLHLRERESPILPFDDRISCPQDSYSVFPQHVRPIIKSLPVSNRQTLGYLCQFLAKLGAVQEDLSAFHTAGLIGPSICRPPRTNQYMSMRHSQFCLFFFVPV
jgi:hypothetical protein